MKYKTLIPFGILFSSIILTGCSNITDNSNSLPTEDSYIEPISSKDILFNKYIELATLLEKGEILSTKDTINLISSSIDAETEYIVNNDTTDSTTFSKDGFNLLLLYNGSDSIEEITFYPDDKSYFLTFNNIYNSPTISTSTNSKTSSYEKTFITNTLSNNNLALLYLDLSNELNTNTDISKHDLIKIIEKHVPNYQDKGVFTSSKDPIDESLIISSIESSGSMLSITTKDDFIDSVSFLTLDNHDDFNEIIFTYKSKNSNTDDFGDFFITEGFNTHIKSNALKEQINLKNTI